MQLTFATPAEVWDVQFLPGEKVRFAVALENGKVQLFDLRSSKTCYLQWQAHHGPVYCLDFQPPSDAGERTCLATGGRELEPSVDERAKALDGLQTLLGGLCAKYDRIFPLGLGRLGLHPHLVVPPDAPDARIERRRAPGSR